MVTTGAAQESKQHTDGPGSRPSHSTPYERLARVLAYDHIDYKHLKIGPREYVEIRRYNEDNTI
jgi:hypothetical protein